MGRSDSSAKHGGHGGVCAAGHGAAEAAAARVNEKRSVGARALLLLFRAYMAALSPIFGGVCKFYPSCSNYAYEAVAKHGARRGAALAIVRLLRCHPFTKGGFDPVPEIIYEQDTLQGLKTPAVCSAETIIQTDEHQPTQAVVAETWSAAGSLGVERRL